MKKLLLAVALLMASFSIMAAPCSAKLLNGAYTYKLTNAKVNKDRIGQITFDGKGGVQYIGREMTSEGAPADTTGYGRYNVDEVTCMAYGNMQYADGTHDAFQIYLNDIKGKNAYSGNVLANVGGKIVDWSYEYDMNMVGTINRVFGK